MPTGPAGEDTGKALAVPVEARDSLATTQRYVRAAGALDKSPAYALASILGE